MFDLPTAHYILSNPLFNFNFIDILGSRGSTVSNEYGLKGDDL